MKMLDSTTQKLLDRMFSMSAAERESASVDEIRLVRKYFWNVLCLSESVDDWPHGPFFNPENVVGRRLDDSHIAAIDDFLSKLRSENSYVRRICADALKWSLYANEGAQLAIEHVSIYEPLLSLFERGFDMRIHHGELIVGGLAVPLATWRDKYSASAAR